MSSTTKDVRALEMRIRELEARNSELERLIRIDPFTGLSNRTGFMDGLEKELSRAARDNAPVAVLMLDGNGIKAINDTHGHLAGDAAILHIADALRACLRSADTAARFGGDEFAAVLHRADKASAQRVAQRILEYLRTHPLSWGNESLTVTVGIGGAVGSGASTAIELLTRADELLVQEAKPADRVSGCCRIDNA
mgnify:CR=1 FL=1